MSPAFYIVAVVAIATGSALAAQYLAAKAAMIANEWEKPRDAFLASDSLPVSGKAGFFKPASWTSVAAAVVTTAIVLGYVISVQSVLAPLEEARHEVMTRLPLCTNASTKPASPQAEPTCTEEVARITQRFAEGRAKLAGNQGILLGFAAFVVLALLFVPHGAYWLHRKWLHNARHVLTPKVFIHQTHLATMLGLLVCSFGAFLLTHFGNSLIEAGNGIADIGSNVISPLAFDSEQYLKTLTAYGPLTQSKMVVDDITHITSGLHIIAAQSFIVLLVLFEIVKESFIKPVLKEGVSEFRHVPPPPAPAKKSENKDNQVQPQHTATERPRVSNPASTGPAAELTSRGAILPANGAPTESPAPAGALDNQATPAPGNGSDAATTTVPKDAKGAATAEGPEAPQKDGHF
ncbi:hypothetical protein OKW30_004638 [Paraburkholderia sp. Clong3]|uniref:hypothetical protein n=1 Tax=Paraburkholderia sp. Clong3 TaxID=2991061 RepID=UPI003D2342D9